MSESGWHDVVIGMRSLVCANGETVEYERRPAMPDFTVPHRDGRSELYAAQTAATHVTNGLAAVATEDHRGHREPERITREIHFAATDGASWSPICNLAEGFVVALSLMPEQITCPCCCDELRKRGHDV